MVFFVPKVFPFTMIIGHGMCGRNCGPISFVYNNLEEQDKIRIADHEQIHEQQFFRDWFYPIKYIFSRKKRLEYEIEAYITIDYLKYKNSLKDIEVKLFTLYDLHLPYSDIEEAVTNYIKKHKL